MCVSRYKQHSFRDKPLGPKSPWLPHPPHSLSPPTRACSSVSLMCVCLSVCMCVCVYVFLFTFGLVGPVRQHSQVVTEKTAVHLSDSEKSTEHRERRTHRHASQDRPVWSEYHHLPSLFTFLLRSPTPLPSHQHPMPSNPLWFYSSLDCKVWVIYTSWVSFSPTAPVSALFIVSDRNELVFTLSFLLVCCCVAIHTFTLIVQFNELCLSGHVLCLQKLLFTVFCLFTLNKIDFLALTFAKPP